MSRTYFREFDVADDVTAIVVGDDGREYVRLKNHGNGQQTILSFDLIRAINGAVARARNWSFPK